MSAASDPVSGRLVIVQGPPGCGKTYFLVALLRELTRQGHRVMVCAPSNKAVCVALELYLATCAPLAAGAEDDSAINCVLVGVEEKLEQCSAQDQDSENYDWLRKPRRAVDVFVYGFGQRVAAELALMAKTVTFLEEEYQRLHALGILAGMAKKLKDKLSLLLLRLGRCCPRTLKRCKVRGAFENKVFPALDGDIEPDILPQLHKILVDFSKAMEHLSMAGDTLPRELIKKANVLFCTLSCAGQGVLRHLKAPDILLVDEAGQSLEAELAVPFLHHPRALVLIGDPKQLPATLLSYEAQRLGYGRSSMQRLMDPVCGYPYVMLDTQYRMDPDLSHFPNLQFYDGKLINSARVVERGNALIETAARNPRLNWLKPFMFLNISYPESGGGQSSICNRGEAMLTSKYASLSSHVLSDIVFVLCVISLQNHWAPQNDGGIKSEYFPSHLDISNNLLLCASDGDSSHPSQWCHGLVRCSDILHRCLPGIGS